VPLVPGDEWYRPHTHIPALTPLYAGRAIINGTFTHPSPIAGLVYSGRPDRQPITKLVEQLDGRRLFGRLWRPRAEDSTVDGSRSTGGDPLPRVLDPDTLDHYVSFLGATVVVIMEEDSGRFPALETNERFIRNVVSPYLVYTLPQSVGLPERVAPGRWRMTLDGASGEWATSRVTFSPLWRAESGGESVPVRRGELGDLELRIPPAARAAGVRTIVDLVYGPGWWEWAGIVVSAAGAVVWMATVLQVLHRRAGERRKLLS
jgi:hypothetical protein